MRAENNKQDFKSIIPGTHSNGYNDVAEQYVLVLRICKTRFVATNTTITAAHKHGQSVQIFALFVGEYGGCSFAEGCFIQGSVELFELDAESKCNDFDHVAT